MPDSAKQLFQGPTLLCCDCNHKRRTRESRLIGEGVAQTCNNMNVCGGDLLVTLGEAAEVTYSARRNFYPYMHVRCAYSDLNCSQGH